MLVITTVAANVGPGENLFRSTLFPPVLTTSFYEKEKPKNSVVPKK